MYLLLQGILIQVAFKGEKKNSNPHTFEIQACGFGGDRGYYSYLRGSSWSYQAVWDLNVKGPQLLQGMEEMR